MPRISVICWVDPANPVLEETLAAYARQHARASDFEVIVTAADTRHDAARAQKHPAAAAAENIRYVSSGVESRAGSNNAAAKQASGSILLFAAADFVPSPEFVHAHLSFHEQHPQEEYVAIGAARSPHDQRANSDFLAWAEDNGAVFGVDVRPHIREVPTQFFYCGNASLKRTFFERAGCFDEAFVYEAADDYEFGLRAAKLGMRSHFVPAAAAMHNHLITFEERKRQVERAGYCAAVLASKHPHTAPAVAPLWQQRVRLIKAALNYALTRRREARIRYWQVRLEEVFSRAYLGRANVG